ncbi:hypothetical protein B0H15DRAFT_798654 [Mycena belliarum]|uniref:Uncharacterized protein n=1 Tax=Mycena belliarum TaxID=1033014 RepID=A0AAD6XTD8_9AGAR|nr:hypothetical protein B0H15DRAFT_798654 [Mycena belliae]
MDEETLPGPLPLDAVFATFTVTEVLAAVGEIVCLPRAAKRNRAVLFHTLELFPDATKARIRALGMSLVGSKRKGKQREGPRKRRRIDTADATAGVEVAMDVEPEDLITGPFLRAATGDCVKECIERAIDHTSNAALAKQICMACARLLFEREMILTPLRAIPNRRHLIPIASHPAHKLTDGLLLHDEALTRGPTYLCADCKRKLTLDERPQYALANNMWIGPTPFQLKILTLPERILVSLYFPAAYVVKLHSKKEGAALWDKRTMNSALKGNVSTYRLNSEHILDIVSGQLKRMPPSPRILAATIAVTFVGPSNQRLSVLPDIFNVRRARVFAALEWLKANNPVYADIEISHEQLLLLPEDGVPEEISANARLSSDVGALAREHESYVPAEIVEDADDAPQLQLHSHGVLDVYGEGVPDSDVFAHGFAHLAADPRQREFKIRRDSAFVNEYPRLDRDGQRFDGGPGNANHMLGAFPVLFPYGKGGLEVDRKVDVPYESHVRWALRYSDGRFRKDLYFMFQAFGVVQKRDVCRSSALQIKRSTFIANQVAFLKLRPRDLIEASAEEGRRVPFSNPVVRKLRKHLTSVRARVMGTDESRIKIRSQIWGMNLRFNPPSIWATINLADVSDPIVQVLAGQNIDLDKFVNTAGPKSTASC